MELKPKYEIDLCVMYTQHPKNIGVWSIFYFRCLDWRYLVCTKLILLAPWRESSLCLWDIGGSNAPNPTLGACWHWETLFKWRAVNITWELALWCGSKATTCEPASPVDSRSRLSCHTFDPVHCYWHKKSSWKMTQVFGVLPPCRKLVWSPWLLALALGHSGYLHSEPANGRFCFSLCNFDFKNK